MIESLIFPSCPAAAQAPLIAAPLALGSRPSTSSAQAGLTRPAPAAPQARLIAATLAFGSRPSTSSAKADFTGPVPRSRPSGCVGASTALDAPSPSVRFEDDFALPFSAGPAFALPFPLSAPFSPVFFSLDRVLLTRL